MGRLGSVCVRFFSLSSGVSIHSIVDIGLSILSCNFDFATCLLLLSGLIGTCSSLCSIVIQWMFLGSGGILSLVNCLHLSGIIYLRRGIITGCGCGINFISLCFCRGGSVRNWRGWLSFSCWRLLLSSGIIRTCII